MLAICTLLQVLLFAHHQLHVEAALSPTETNLAKCLTANRGSGLFTVITPDSASFTADAAYRNWQGRHDSRRPAAVAFPTTQQQVQAAVVCANAANIPFVARSGGHSYEAMSLINGGLIIDLTNMTALNWVTKRSKPAAVIAEAAAAAGSKAGIISAGPGTRLGVLYSWLADRSLMFPGGTCPGVGTSGFLLGGGQGHSVRKHGLAADSVVGATVVTAAGKSLEVNATHNSDLWWAIRGGGANYGIVTEWKLQLYRQPAVVTTVLVDAPLTVPHLSWLLTAFMQWKPWLLPGDHASIDLRIEGDACGIKLVYWGPADEAKQQLSKVAVFADSPTAIAAKVTYIQDPFNEVILDWTKASGALLANAPWDNTLMKNFQTPGKLNPVTGYKSYRYQGGLDFSGAGFIMAEPLSGSAVNAVSEVVVKHHMSMKAADRFPVAYLTVWGGQVAAQPTDSSGFGWRKRIINFQIGTPMRAGNADDAGYAKRVQQQLLPFTKGAMFYNYMSCLAGQDPYTKGDKWQAFFGPSSERLQKIKAKYDPKAVFAYGMNCEHLDR